MALRPPCSGLQETASTRMATGIHAKHTSAQIASERVLMNPERALKPSTTAKEGTDIGRQD